MNSFKGMNIIISHTLDLHGSKPVFSLKTAVCREMGMKVKPCWSQCFAVHIASGLMNNNPTNNSAS